MKNLLIATTVLLFAGCASIEQIREEYSKTSEFQNAKQEIIATYASMKVTQEEVARSKEVYDLSVSHLEVCYDKQLEILSKIKKTSKTQVELVVDYCMATSTPSWRDSLNILAGKATTIRVFKLYSEAVSAGKFNFSAFAEKIRTEHNDNCEALSKSEIEKNLDTYANKEYSGRRSRVANALSVLGKDLDESSRLGATTSRSGGGDKKGCRSDYECSSGQRCFKPSDSNNGTCAVPVNRYGNTDYQSMHKNYGRGLAGNDCSYRTDCEHGFNCHKKAGSIKGICLKN